MRASSPIPSAGLALHPRGIAADVTLSDPGTGAVLDMGTGFDDMTPRSARDSLDLPAAALRNRALLLGVMAAVGWESIPSEWWHYQVPNLPGLPTLGAADVPDGPMDAVAR